MKKYRCYFCSSIDDSLEDIVDHCIDSHSKNTLKYRELELDERSGKLRYQTQIDAGVIPSNNENDGKTIIVSKDFFLRDNGSKQKRLNTPKKVVDTKPSLQFNDHDDQTECQDEDMILQCNIR